MSSQTAQIDGPGFRVIEPKLMPPRVHPGMLRRARLLEMLDDDAAGSFTVLNAAVGYGKTTLVRSWCVERPEAVIWLTLDSVDDDPVRLWTHLATAVERLGEGFGRRALMCLAVRGATVETAVDELMNGLVAYGRRVSIVLDDLHAVRSESSVGSIAYALERLPANVRLLASTRSDPAIGLGRLRARRVLTEVRAHELAFTVDETRELVVREGIGLSNESVELLVDRTEGWPAGLYLAALWLRDLRDPDGGVRDFAGSARQVGEYLGDEVLTALAPEIRDFLVRTSVLPRFTPELCDAVLGREDSAAVLAELARSNMFLVALDARGEWYRYHHLFGEFLQLELGREDARELRRRAAGWCRAHGLAEDAIEYAAAAGDAEMVAEVLIERHLEFIWGGRLGQFLGWVRWLPVELLVEHPVLPGAGAVAAALLSAPEVEVHRLLAVAERARRERPELWLPYLEAGVEVARSQIIEGGDVGAAVEHARRAVAAAQEGADVLSVSALGCLAQALFFAGELDEARRVAVQTVERPDAPGVPDAYVGSLGLLALVDAEQGRTESAEAWARQAFGLRAAALPGGLVGCLTRASGACAGMCGHGPPRRGRARGAARRASATRATADRRPRARAARTRPGAAGASAAGARRGRPRARKTCDRGVSGSGSVAGDRGHDRADPRRGSSEHRNTAASSKSPVRAELAVLRGLAAGLSRREIGAQLYISLNTVKSHTRELYRKLGATSQAEAVARAEELGLLETGQSPG